MNRCEMFVCKYISTCLIGGNCENGKYRVCNHNFCDMCKISKQCKQKGEKKK